MTLAVSYQNFCKEARIATATTVSAVLMVVLPLIVITASLPTLKLGVTLKQLRFILVPSAAVLGASPLMIFVAIKCNRARNRAFKPYMDELKERVDAAPLTKEATKAEKKEFRNLLLKDLVKNYHATDFRYFLLTELANSYPKKSPKREAIEKARAKSLDS